MNPERYSKLTLSDVTKNPGFGTDFSPHPLQSSTGSVYDSFLRIADITIGLACGASDLMIHFTGAKERFLANGGEPEIKIEVCWDELKENPPGKEIFDSKTGWKLYSYDGSYLFRFTSPDFGSIPYKEALFDSEFSVGKIRLNRSFYSLEQSIDPLEYPLDELLISNFLSRGRGVEVQACGVVNSQGDGCLFLDHSGDGKSTTARIRTDQHQFMVLGDSRIILRRQEGILWIYSAPWQEDSRYVSPGRAPLKRVYFLRKGLKDELIPLSRADVMGRFLASCFPLSYSQESANFIVSFFDQIPGDIPCFELRLPPDAQIVDLILANPEDLITQ